MGVLGGGMGTAVGMGLGGATHKVPEAQHRPLVPQGAGRPPCRLPAPPLLRCPTPILRTSVEGTEDGGDKLQALRRGDRLLPLRARERPSIRLPELLLLRCNSMPILRPGPRPADASHRASRQQLMLTGPVRVSGSLEDVVDAANHALGVAAAARLDGALEALAALPVRILADNGSSRSRPRRILARLQRISEGQLLADEEDEEQWPAASGSRRRRVPDQVKLAGRIERHASRGSVRRAAAALEAAPLADTSDPVVIAKLRALHPEADAPAALETDVPAIQISEESLVAVEKRLSANSRGTAGGVTGWTYEQALVPVRVSSEGRRAVLQFVNLILSGKLPRSCFLLESLLVGLEKTKDEVPTGDVRPIAIGEVWYRLAMICALVQKGHEVGAALGYKQVGVATKGGVDAVAHAVVTAL